MPSLALPNHRHALLRYPPGVPYRSNLAELKAEWNNLHQLWFADDCPDAGSGVAGIWTSQFGGAQSAGIPLAATNSPLLIPTAVGKHSAIRYSSNQYHSRTGAITELPTGVNSSRVWMLVRNRIVAGPQRTLFNYGVSNNSSRLVRQSTVSSQSRLGLGVTPATNTYTDATTRRSFAAAWQIVRADFLFGTFLGGMFENEPLEGTTIPTSTTGAGAAAVVRVGADSNGTTFSESDIAVIAVDGGSLAVELDGIIYNTLNAIRQGII